MARKDKISSLDDGEKDDAQKESRRTHIIAHRGQKALTTRWRLKPTSKKDKPRTKLINSKTDPAKALSRDLAVKIPTSLGEPFADIHGVFQRIDSPHIRNIRSLWHWLSVSNPGDDTPGGWLAGMHYYWGDIIFQQGPCEAALLSILTYFAIRKHGELTANDTIRYANRAKIITITEMQNYKQVTPSLLVIIAKLAVNAVAEGDFKAVRAHRRALTALGSDVDVSVSEWMFVRGLDIRLAGNMMSGPALSYYIPPELREPISLTVEQMSKCNRLGSENALAFSRLVEGDFLRVREIFIDLHSCFTAFSAPMTGQPSPSIFGQIYNAGYHCMSFLGRCRSEAPPAQRHYREILAIVIELGFWQTIKNMIPQEGATQHNVLGRAAAIMQLHGNVFYETLAASTSNQGMIWLMANLTMEASLWRHEDLHLWIPLLERALENSNLTSEELEMHIAQWPYASSHLQVISNDLWQPVRNPGVLSEDPVKAALVKRPILL